MANSSNRHNLPQGFVMGDEVIIEPSWSEIDDAEVEDAASEPTLADVLTELKAIRELLVTVSGGGVAIRTRQVNS